MVCESRWSRSPRPTTSVSSSEWQHCSAASRATGVGGLLDVIEQMQGLRGCGRRVGVGDTQLARGRVQSILARRAVLLG